MNGIISLKKMLIWAQGPPETNVHQRPPSHYRDPQLPCFRKLRRSNTIIHHIYKGIPGI